MDAPDREADHKDSRTGGGISLQTLMIASAASAVASFAASRIWGAGTLISAAATPVIVALVAEFLRRPVQTVAETAKKVPTVQTLPLPGARRRTFAAPGDTTRALDDAARASTDPPTQHEREPPSAEPIPPGPDELPGDDEAGGWRPRWPVVVVTGLLAFAIVVALYTVPDLISGSSITGNGEATTLFGGSASTKKASPTSTVTTVTTIITTTPTTTTTQSTTTQSTSTATTTTTTSTTPTTNTAPTTTQTTTSTTPPAINPTTTSTTSVP